MTWYSRMDVKFSLVKLARFPPMAWKAALFGMKTVRSSVLSTVLASDKLVRAPTAEVRLRATAVVEMFCGRVRNRSMM